MREATGLVGVWRAGPVRTGFLLTALTLLGVVLGYVGEARGSSWLVGVFFGLAFLAGGVPAAREAVRGLWVDRKLDVDLLMVVAALGAASVGEAGDGAILLFLFSLSNTLQDWAMGRTKDAIRALMVRDPEGATVIGEDGVERWVGLEDLTPGVLIRVRPGERIPADATLVEGYSSVDESELTGESVPVEKEPGSPLYSGTLNGEGVLVARVERPASEVRQRSWFAWWSGPRRTRVRRSSSRSGWRVRIQSRCFCRCRCCLSPFITCSVSDPRRPGIVR